ncbi:MAG TPA: hypothetical protein PKC72_13235 [Chitinophagaceae bacterium]|nr:hypothetical protein [Chitinophagaceae bacterium]
MKKVSVIFMLATIVLLASCKKDSEAAKPEFADIEFSMYDLRATGDSTITEIIYPSTIVLKSDYTWTIDLDGSKSSGTYTWTPTSTQQADTKFTIVNWTGFTPNPILSDKLKSALLAVNHCGYSLQIPSYANYLTNNYQDICFPFLRTNKK